MPPARAGPRAERRASILPLPRRPRHSIPRVPSRSSGLAYRAGGEAQSCCRPWRCGLTALARRGQRTALDQETAMFRKLYDWTLRWAGSRHAPVAMGTVSFVESSVFPIPADVLFIPMVLAKPDQAWRFALIATVTSVLGGVFGWMIGHYAFDLVAAPLLEFYGKMAAFDALKSQTGDTAILVMLVTSGLTHLPPMKVFIEKRMALIGLAVLGLVVLVWVGLKVMG